MKIFMLNVFGVVVALLILVGGKMTFERDLGYVPTSVTLSQPTEFELWADAIAEFESGGDPRAENKYGMMGKYQFSPTTVAYLGFKESKEEFLNNPYLQDSVFTAYVYTNKKELQSLIDKYSGKKRNGVRITPAAVLAGAHFAGANGVRKFLEDGVEVIDSNGTTVTYYMKRFGSYDLET